jgi:H+/gluconate symporter-like permease
VRVGVEVDSEEDQGHPATTGDPLVSAAIAVTLIAGLDSLPHNGYVVTTIRGVCRETHKSAYSPVFCMTVAVPMFGLIVALLLL